MSALPWQSIFILGFVVGAFVTGCGLTWFYFNVKGDLDGVADGADGDCEPVPAKGTWRPGPPPEGGYY